MQAQRINRLIAHVRTQSVATATATAHPILIGGKLVAAENNAVIEVINPATGKVFDTVPDASRNDLDRAVASAKEAFASWKSTPYPERAACLLKFADLVEANAKELAKALSMEQGKPLAFAMAETMGVAAECRHLAEIGEMKPEVTYEDDKIRQEIHKIPRGVVGGITPWNFPLSMAANKLLPAVITGNTVIVKPSPYTPISTVMLSGLAAEAFPAGVMNILSGGDGLGQWMVEHPDIVHISFTGSKNTGSRILKTGADNIKKITLELGGNDPAIVLPDADIKSVAPQIFGRAMFNTGQVCVAVKRVFVHESQYDEMVEGMKQAAEGAAGAMGDGLDKSTRFGPINNKMQLERVEGLVADAVKDGATVVAGGKRFDPTGSNPDAYFYQPTIIGGAKEGMRIVDEEQFGPVIPILKYSSVDDAIERANATEFGLGGSVWTSDPEGAGVEVANQIDSGMVWINDHMGNHPSAPFGGVKMSGIGREGGGTIGLQEFVDMKAIKITKKKQPKKQ
jgi:acyl-CoA reductase-like NAD-dependent aldehyde dehydrogenase